MTENAGMSCCYFLKSQDIYFCRVKLELWKILFLPLSTLWILLSSRNWCIINVKDIKLNVNKILTVLLKYINIWLTVFVKQTASEIFNKVILCFLTHAHKHTETHLFNNNISITEAARSHKCINSTFLCFLSL